MARLLTSQRTYPLTYPHSPTYSRTHPLGLQSTTYEPLAAEHDPEWFMGHVGGLENVSRLAAAMHFDTQAPPQPLPPLVA